jgi:hypothetical protein
MGARPDAIPNAAGGEGGHGAATPDGAIHTYSDSQNLPVAGIPCRIYLPRIIPAYAPTELAPCDHADYQLDTGMCAMCPRILIAFFTPKH